MKQDIESFPFVLKGLILEILEQYVQILLLSKLL